jgi:ceramide synthetase
MTELATVARDVAAWFWNSDVWLPPNVTWDSFNEEQIVKEKIVIEPKDFARFNDLWYPLPCALFVIVLRWMVEKWVFKPIGIRLGLKDRKRRPPPHNQVLEEAFSSRRSSASTNEEEDVNKLSQAAGISPIQVQRWLRRRRQAELPTTLHKFCETGWRWMFYTGILVYGFVCLWDKPWFWNIRHCWYDYPYHAIDPDVWLYYMIELSFYWSLSISQFFDVKRKDFWEMFVHHNTTIALMMFSWSAHFTRIGTLVLIVHDCSDHLLELAKLFRYTRKKKACEVIFILFSLTWIITRCGVYPSWILYSTLYDAAGFIQMFPAYYIFNSLLGTLQLLHILWTYFLVRAIHRALTKGNVADDRSDDEPSDDESDKSDFGDVKKQN